MWGPQGGKVHFEQPNRIDLFYDVQGQALPQRVAQLPQLGGGGEENVGARSE